MIQKPFTTATAVILAIIAGVHLLRLLSGWQVTVGDLAIPVWWSAPAIVVFAGLAWMVWREMRP
jgi:hypothetical protein